MSVFQISLHGLSFGNCTMVIQPLKDNHQYLSLKKIIFYKLKLYFKEIKIKYLFLNLLNRKIVLVVIYINRLLRSIHCSTA